MAKVLLVDDEKNIRNGLRAIISRTDSVFTEINECSNGVDALHMLSQYKYDLLITDLLMPQMDGIELVAKIYSMDYKPYIVILSGYDDFKYAQKAINYGVKAYLLKPVDRKELINILKKAETEIIAKQNDNYVQTGNPVTEFYENQISMILLDENLSKDEIDKILSVCELDVRNQGFNIVVMNYCETYESKGKRENNSVLNSFLRKRLVEMHSKGYSFLDRNGNVVAIVDNKIDIHELLDPIEKMYGFRYAAGMGQCGKTFYDMHQSYIEAEYALRYRLLDPSDRVVRFSDILHLDNKYIIPVRLLKNLAGMLDTERRDDLCRLVYRIFDENVINKYSLDYLEKLSNTFKDEIIQYLSECIPNKIDFIQEQKDSFKGVYEFVDIQEYVHYISSYILNINNVLLKMKNTCNSDDEIDKAVKYVRENYCKDLTMAEVANRICLNYSYFSLLFKGKTGMNFIDYLKTIRIEKAKELLKNTDYKVYEISGMVGYNNTKHFTTTFRVFTGISPKEYRERIYIN